MIGIIEIAFSTVMFCVIWFLIFKFKLMISEKKRFKNMFERIEKQDVKTDLINEIKGVQEKLLSNKEKIAKEIEEKKKSKKPEFLGKFKLFKKKKEVKKE